MGIDDEVRQFFRRHAARPVGLYPDQKEIETPPEDREQFIEWGVEQAPDDWTPVILPESPARPGECPERFIDGCHSGHAVACLRAPDTGWPVPVCLAEVGGVAMRLQGRELVREFYGVERVVSFVADPFAWDEVEAFSTAIGNLAEFPLRMLPASLPDVANAIDLFDYERMRKAAQNRTTSEMANWEAVTLSSGDRDTPTLVDGPLERRLRSATAAARFQLVVGVVKTHSANLLHPQGWRTLLNLKPGQRTPYFRLARTITGEANDLPVVTWFIKMAGKEEPMPNWASVRVEVPWVQFERFEGDSIGFVNRLSRWLIDARCRQQSYARMPVSLEPIVRAEDSLKSLFTPFDVLRNRFLRHTGVAGSAPL